MEKNKLASACDNINLRYLILVVYISKSLTCWYPRGLWHIPHNLSVSGLMPAGSLHCRNAQYGFFQQILISDNYPLLMTNINKITDNFTYLHWSFSFFLLYFLSLKKNLVLYYCPPLLLKYTMCHYGQLSAEVITTKDIYVYENVREHNIYSVEALRITLWWRLLSQAEPFWALQELPAHYVQQPCASLENRLCLLLLLFLPPVPNLTQKRRWLTRS